MTVCTNELYGLHGVRAGMCNCFPVFHTKYYGVLGVHNILTGMCLCTVYVQYTRQVSNFIRRKNGRGVRCNETDR